MGSFPLLYVVRFEGDDLFVGPASSAVWDAARGGRGRSFGTRGSSLVLDDSLRAERSEDGCSELFRGDEELASIGKLRDILG